MTMFTSPRSGAARRRRRARVAAAAVLSAAIGSGFASTMPAAARDVAQADAAMHRAAATERPEQWLWPVPAPVRVVSPFRAPPTPYAPGHRGIDLDVEHTAVIIAPAAGVVSFAGRVVDRGVVAIDHGDGVVSAIEPVEAVVTEGAVVDAGDPIGTAASGGHCAAECAHFGVRIDGEYVSPFLFLGGLPQAVLLPMP